MLQAKTRGIDRPSAWGGITPSVYSTPPHVFTSAHHRLNDVLAVALVGIVAISPLPLASNRPIFWAASAFALSVMSLFYWLGLFHLRQPPRFSMGRLAPEIFLFTCLCGCLVLQIVPLGNLVQLPPFTVPLGETLATTTLSLAPGATWLMLLRMLTYGLFFLLVLQTSVNPHRAQAMLMAIFAVIVGYAGLGLFMLTQMHDTIFGLEKWAYLGSATATFVNRNSFATFLASGLALGSALLLPSLGRKIGAGGQDMPVRRDWTKALAIILGLVVIGIALLATQSRMGLFVGLLGSVVVVVHGRRKAGLRWRMVALWVVVALAATGFIAANFSGVLDRAISVEDSTDVRATLYQQVLEMIARRPWLGYGGGSFDVAFPLFHSAPVNTTFIWEKAHSTYLELWVELGIIAGSIPIVLIGIALLHSAIGFARAQRHWQPGLAAIGVAVVGAIHSTVDFSLEIQAMTFLFLAVLAIGTGSQAYPKTD